MNTAQIQIDRVTDSDEYQPEGKKYKVCTFTCDGYIDGESATGFLVKAIGKEKIDVVQPGFACEMEIDVYKGKTKYVIPKDYKRNAPRQSPPPPAAGQGAARPRAQASDLTVEEFDELFTHAIATVRAATGETAITDPISKLVSTYIIAAMDNGIRMKKKEPEHQAPEEAPVDINVIIEVLDKKGLTKRVEDAGISEDDLIGMWKGSGASPLKFGILVNETLKKKEEGADSIPF